MPAPVLTRVLLALLAVGHLGLTTASGQTPRPMGIVDQLNVPRLGDVQLVARRPRRALYAGRSGLEERQADFAHLAREGGWRAAGPADERRRRRERAALVAGSQDDRLHRRSAPATSRRRFICCRSTAAKRAG